MQAHCARRRRPILSRPSSMHLSSLHPPAAPASLPLFLFAALRRNFFCICCSVGFFFPASPSPRLHVKANTTLIYLPVSAGTHVIYCDLIAFNSSGATVNHRASRIARVRHACCRYDVITSIREPVWMRAAIAMCRAALVNG